VLPNLLTPDLADILRGGLARLPRPAARIAGWLLAPQLGGAHGR